MANATHCPEIDVDNGRLNSTARHVGVTVNVSCSDGYELRGFDKLTCTASGDWNHFWPLCVSTTTEEDDDNHVTIIAICVVAIVVVLGIVIFALYMLCSNMRKERSEKVQQRDVLENIRDMSSYHAVTQDCVGMPALVYDNMYTTLRGKGSASEESESAGSGSPVEHEIAGGAEKDFIY